MTWSGLADLYQIFSQHNGIGSFADAMQTHDLGKCHKPQPISSECTGVSWLDGARKVCQSVAFCTSAEALEGGPPRVSKPLNIVIETMKDRKEGAAEYAWALKAREVMGERWVRLLCYQP